MTLFGVVCDTRNPSGTPDPAALQKFDAVRLTAFLEPSFFAYAQQIKAAGLKLAVVFPTESFGGTTRYGEVAGAIAREVDADWYLLGNEQDADLNLNPDTGLPWPSGASSPLKVAPFARMYRAAENAIRSERPTARVGTGGFSSGHPEAAAAYLGAVGAQGGRIDFLSVHPYAKGAEDARALLRAYQTYGYPLVVDEWSRLSNEIPNFAQMLAEERVELACFHAWHQTDIEGLHDAGGHATAAYYALIDGITAAKIRRHLEVSTMTQAIEDRATAIGPEKLGNNGEKNGPSRDLGGGVIAQPYWNCVLVDFGESGVYVFPEGTVIDTFRS